MESIFVQFRSSGENIGPPLSIPKSTTYSQMNSLINELLKSVSSRFVADTEG